MTDPQPHTEDDAPHERESPPGMPRWMKVSAIVVGVLVLLFVVLTLLGVGGDHGPGRH
ncbi:MAG: hypothetical protein ACRDXX_11160 [Stackebrandtia sp.]